ncbi:GNAT family N-acetyltransferase [Pseudarthrobacter sp. P1]|uniref:GNAT family N-acetyltransferase n=1 Tax=Pseudarthrobacter sp. P1 TaxID=3418418 RepID=UPI003CEB8CFE
MSEQQMGETAEGFHNDVTMLRNDARHRYELHVGSALACILLFKELPGHIDLIHTEIQPGFEGHGLGNVLDRYALDDVVASGKRIIPHCPHVAKYIHAHPDEYTQYTDWPGQGM